MRDLGSITTDDLISAYSGKLGKCCCGCSGTHSYLDAAEGTARRGYLVEPDEVNRGQCTRVLNAIKRAASIEWLDDSIVTAEIGSRVYVAYLR